MQVSGTGNFTIDSEAGYRALFEYATVGILVTDQTGIIKLVNPALEKLLGYTNEELHNQQVSILIPDQFHKAHHHHLHDYFAKPTVKMMGQGRNLYARKKDGSTIQVEIGLGFYPFNNSQMAVAFVSDISERIRAQESLLHSMEMTDLVIRSSLDAVICVDSNGLITIWNGQAEKIFGYKDNEIIGKHFADYLIPEKYRHLYKQGLSDYKKGYDIPDINRLIEIKAINKCGREFPVELSMIPVKQKGHNFFCAFVRDITERKENEWKSKEYRAQLERKNRELEQFAYVASHDLQEPLRTTAGFLNLFKRKYEDQIDADANQYITYMHDAILRMKTLINDLLQYSRIGSNVKPEMIDCNEIISELKADMHASITERNANILAQPLPHINGYRTEIKLLFQNLLSNSIKFCAPNTEPVIEISARKESGFYLFTFKDNGIGINPTQQERVFGLFQRLHTQSEYAGSGIGLAHCKKIVELHNGQIWLKSVLNQGTTFYFTIRSLMIH